MECHTDQQSELPMPPVVVVPGFAAPERVAAVNTPCPDDAPEISGDGQRLYVWFQNYHDPEGVDFFNATEVRVFQLGGSGWDGPYVYPVDLGTTMSLDGEVSHTSAGDRVYFQSLRPENIVWPAFDGDVYVADVVDGVPEPAVLLGSPVSTEHLDGEMAVSRDGDELFVASDRDDPGGPLRLYRFQHNGTGWDGPEQLTGEINAAGVNLQPFLTADEQHLYWTSDRIGYFQIYRAARLGDNEWGPAELAVEGPPVGSPSLTDDNGTLCFAALVPAQLIPELGGNEADVFCAAAVESP